MSRSKCKKRKKKKAEDEEINQGNMDE